MGNLIGSIVFIDIVCFFLIKLREKKVFLIEEIDLEVLYYWRIISVRKVIKIDFI